MEELKKLGLSISEIIIYTFLLQSGSKTISDISEKTGIYRTNVYDILKKLKSRGLLQIKEINNKKYYTSEDPINLNKLYDQKKQEILSQKDDLQKAIEKLSNNRSIDSNENISIYFGLNGIDSFYEAIFRKANVGDNITIIGSNSQVTKTFTHHLLNLTKRAQGMKLKGKVLVSKKLISNQVLKNAYGFLNLDTKFIDESYLSPIAIFMINNIIGFISLLENPFVLLIENNPIIDQYRDHFERLVKISE